MAQLNKYCEHRTKTVINYAKQEKKLSSESDEYLKYLYNYTLYLHDGMNKVQRVSTLKKK